MVQIRLSVGSALKMSIQAVVGSGITSMSEALMTFQPRMLEPSNPIPSVKMSSLYSVRVVVKCCQVPGKSVNLKSINFTSLSLIILLTSDGVFSLGIGEVDPPSHEATADRWLRVEGKRNDEIRMTNAEGMTK